MSARTLHYTMLGLLILRLSWIIMRITLTIFAQVRCVQSFLMHQAFLVLTFQALQDTVVTKLLLRQYFPRLTLTCKSLQMIRSWRTRLDRLILVGVLSARMQA